MKVSWWCVLASTLLASYSKAEESCELDLYLVLDASGSMKDNNDACLLEIQKDWGDAEYNENKACWEVLSAYAREAHSIVKYICQRAGQKDPRVSIMTAHCPSTGKDKKILLSPTTDAAAINDAFTRLRNQATRDDSCAFGALDQVRDWIKQTNGEDFDNRNADDGEPVVVLPKSDSPKTPVVLFLSDGFLDDAVDTERVTTKLREKFGTTLITASPLPKAGTISRLTTLTGTDDLVFDATDPDSLRSVAFRVGSFQTSLENVKFCSDRQFRCVEERSVALQDQNQCSDNLSRVFTGIASCAGTGCVGMDLTTYKDSCLEKAANQSCRVDCSDIALHVNAQVYPPLEEGAGFEATSSFPGFNENRFGSAASFELPLEISWAAPQGAISMGGSASPIVDNEGKLIAVRNDGQTKRGFVHRIDPESGEELWSFSAFQPGAFFHAQPVVGSSSSDSLFIGDSQGIFYQLEASTGLVKRSWNLGPGPILSAAAVPNNSLHIVVAVGGSPGVSPAFLHKIALHDHNSKRAWKRAVCDEQSSSDNVVQGVVVTRGQGVAISCRNGFVELYTLSNGSLLWRHRTTGNIKAIPVIDENSGFVFILASNSTSSSLVKVNTLGGSEREIQLEAPARAIPMLSNNNTSIIVALATGKLVEYSLDDGNLLNSLTIPSQTSQSLQGNVVRGANGLLAIVNEAFVSIVNGTSFELLTEVSLPGSAIGSPLLLDGSLFVQTETSFIVKLTRGAEKEPTMTRRRVLLQDIPRQLSTESKEWPVAAIVLTVVFGLLFIVLVFVVFRLYRATKSSVSE